jgi:excisionase family DNA binding protein
MKPNPSLFTTGQAARICNVAQQTIIRLFDAGMLKGFRIPGSTHRRIPRQSLLALMREAGMPIPDKDALTVTAPGPSI